MPTATASPIFALKSYMPAAELEQFQLYVEKVSSCLHAKSIEVTELVLEKDPKEGKILRGVIKAYTVKGAQATVTGLVEIHFKYKSGLAFFDQLWAIVERQTIDLQPPAWFNSFGQDNAPSAFTATELMGKPTADILAQIRQWVKDTLKSLFD